MITRSFDGGRLNELANHPDIRPGVGGDGTSYLDLGPVLANPDNYVLLGPHGGFVATWTAPHTYEVHTFILPEGRGQAAYELAQEFLATMTEVGAEVIWTRVAEDAPHVRRFTLKAGFTPCGEQVCDFGGGPTLYHLFRWRSPCPLAQ